MPMYLEHFNLSTVPFSQTPDTRFYVESDQNDSLFIKMVSAVNQDDGIVCIVGDAGSGKTIHCRKLLNALRCHQSRYTVIHIPNPRLSEEGFYLAIAHELRLKTISTRAKLKISIIKHLAKQISKKGRNSVIVIDEAQTMPDDTLEALIGLLDITVDGQQLLRAALFSMPIDLRLADLPAMRQLQDRITLNKELAPFSNAGVHQYIETRLNKAGASGAKLYSDEAVELIAKGSKGIPRVINLLAHKSLMNAYNAKLQQVQALQVRLAIAATEFMTTDEIEFKPSWFSRLRNKTV